VERTLTEPGQVVLTVFDGKDTVKISVSTNQRLFDVLRQHGIYLNAPCGGRGTCGKCRITLMAGRLMAGDDGAAQPRIIEPGQSALACRCSLIDDCSIDVGSLTEKGFSGIADSTIRQLAPIDAGYEKLQFVPSPSGWEAGISVSEAICHTLERRLSFSPKALRQLSDWFSLSLQNRFRAPDGDTPIWLTVCDNRTLHIHTVETASIFGIGVDIGTTTIALSLVNLETGEVVKNMTLLNSQRQFGADVISRIQKGVEGFTADLQACLRSDLVRAVQELCQRQETEAVVQLVIAGNTTMLHMLLGLRADSLAVYPFNPLTKEQLVLSTKDLFGLFPVECEVTLLPSLGAYVGADIIAGMAACGMDRAAQLSLLVDVGTNGEMAIGNKERILCTSTAAGPAFEGANISCGVGSVPGAIAKFDMQGGQAMIQTIADAPPIGICGTGVVDIVAIGLREGLIDRTGRLQANGTDGDSMLVARQLSGEAILFTQKDIREFQLAKAAIRTGLEILLREYGCGWPDVGQVFLAGGFGAKIDVTSAVAVGLLPGEVGQRIQAVGNSSLGGTVAYLLHRERRRAVDSLLKVSASIDLSRHPDFNELFMMQLEFGPAEGTI